MNITDLQPDELIGMPVEVFINDEEGLVHIGSGHIVGIANMCFTMQGELLVEFEDAITPVILLDDGRIVYGFETMWIPKAVIEELKS